MTHEGKGVLVVQAAFMKWDRFLYFIVKCEWHRNADAIVNKWKVLHRWRQSAVNDRDLQMWHVTNTTRIEKMNENQLHINISDIQNFGWMTSQQQPLSLRAKHSPLQCSIQKYRLEVILEWNAKIRAVITRGNENESYMCDPRSPGFNNTMKSRKWKSRYFGTYHSQT